MSIAAILAATALAVAAPLGLASQSLTAETAVAGTWDNERVLELVRRAQALRAETQVDTAFLSYQADARGYVYFYLDRRDTGERNLIKTDQVALDVYWRAPDLVKQRIVGWRDEKKLPTNIQYHIDHLAVVHDNFGDLIRIGDGDEVRDVLHPAAPGAESFYEYRLADSLTLRLPGSAEPVRVYELQVRPRDAAQPALLGSLFIDRRSGAIVRMDFTFTPAAYVDRNLDYINISLDNGLWLERFWLPNRQRLELRRQIPELDVPAGAVIRGTMRVSNYRFNVPLPSFLFAGPSVVLAPRQEREAFPFEEDIYAELRAEGIGPAMELTDIRRQALELMRHRNLSGLPGLRLHLGAASDVLRYNRAEGLVLGLGVSGALSGGTTGTLRGGWAFGAEHPVASAELVWQRAAFDLGAAGFVNLPRELGGAPAASGVMNTLGTLFAGVDYTDPYYTRGAGLRATWRVESQWSLGGGLRLEEHRSAELSTEYSIFGIEPLRPVAAIDDGRLRAAQLQLHRVARAEASRWWSASLSGTAGSLELNEPPATPWRPGETPPTLDFLSVRADVAAGSRWAARAAELELLGTAGHAWGELPRQELFVIGGRGTVPGFGFRHYGGSRVVTAKATFSADLQAPWVRGRLHAASGWTAGGSPADRAAALLGIGPTDRVLGSVGAGLGLFFDLIRVDAFRGLGRDGRWELMVETRRTFWDFL